MTRSIVMPARQAGFTLIEAVVAFAILAMSCGVVYRVFGDSLLYQNSLQRRQTAVALAESKLAELNAEIPLHPGVQQGKTPDGTRWQVSVTPYMEPGLAVDPRLPLRLFALEVQVTWQDRGQPYQLALHGLRLGSVE